MLYPSNKICPHCGKGGYVYYLNNSDKYTAKCINCGFYFEKGSFPEAVKDKVGECEEKLTDILIRGMKMPEQGAKAVIIHSNGHVYADTSDPLFLHKIADVIELPEHGDLIDRGSLKEVWEKELPALLGEQYETADMGEIHKSYIEELGFRPVIVPSNKEAAD